MSKDSEIEYYARQSIEAFLKPWLKIPSISSDESKKMDCINAARKLETQLGHLGFSVSEQQLEVGNPVVYAENLNAGKDKPTVLIYGHYDVQPIHEPDSWVVDGQKLDPFNPTQIGDRLYARGATDDKGQLDAWVAAMLYFSYTADGLPCNVKFVIEGNEEGGKSSFYEWVPQNADLLACDAVLISDTGTMKEGYPTLTTDLKGLLKTDVTAEDPKDLVKLITSSHDVHSNRSYLRGFYDKVVERTVPENIEREFGKPKPDMGTVLNPEQGYTQLHHRRHRPTNSPLFLSYADTDPADIEGGLTVKLTTKGPEIPKHSGSYGGPVIDPCLYLCSLLTELEEMGMDYNIDNIFYGSRVLSTAIQPEAEAQITIKPESGSTHIIMEALAAKVGAYHAKLEEVEYRNAYITDDNFSEDKFDDGSAMAYMSFRLVPDMEPDDVFDSLEALAADISDTIKVEKKMQALPFSTDPNNPYAAAVIEGLKQGFGIEGDVHIMAEGGSIPITHTLYDTLKAPVIMAGLSSEDDNLHGPNESILVEKGIIPGAKSFVYALEKLAAMGPGT